MSSAKGKPPKGIPFIAEFAQGGERNARMELQRLTALKAPSPAEAALRVELERYLADPFISAAQDQEAREKVFNGLLDEAEQRAAPFVKGRKPGSVSKKARYIHKLVTDNPNLSAKELYDKADGKIRGTLGTFRNHVSRARQK